MNQSYKEKIAAKLYEKGVNQPCPRCASFNFEVVGQTLLALAENPQNIIVGGPAVPSAIIACSHCGFITLHAISALNLMLDDNR